MGDFYGHASAPAPSRPAGGLDQGKIFVGGLSWQTTTESLRYHFEQYGPVASVEVMRDRVTGDPRGFAFVVFQNLDTVDAVMDEPNHEINHKIVDVKRAQARGVAPPSIHERRGGGGAPSDAGDAGDSSSVVAPVDSGAIDRRGNFSSGGGNNFGNTPRNMTPEQLQNKVFVGGIPPSVDSEELKQIFGQFGTVVDAIVMIDQATNRSRCFGFVTFENGSNGAQRVIEVQPLEVQGRNVEVKLATPKAEQRRTPAATGPKNVGLRAGISPTTSGEYAGLAVAYGRNGWKAGYGTKAFGKAGWAVKGWEDGGPAPERSGFSFSMIKRGNAVPPPNDNTRAPPPKRARY